MSYLLNDSERNYDAPLINQQEANEIQKDYFEKYLKSKNQLGNNIWSLYYSMKRIDVVEQSGKTRNVYSVKNEEATELLSNFISENNKTGN